MNTDSQTLIEALHREARECFEDRPHPPVEAPTVAYTELPEANPDSPLCHEWNTYRREVGRLLAEGHEDRHVLIKDEQVVGIWETHEKALAAGYQRFLGQPFLVHQIQQRERLLRCVSAQRCRN